MAIYAIGDVQGCFDELEILLDKINFNPCIDRLWFTGDLVNRGPKSLETLRFVKSLADIATVVLGNHDLHLLASYFGKGKVNDQDTLQGILNSRDCAELIDWLTERPFMHHEDGYCLVHAGVAPQWDLSLAKWCARKCESVLRSRAEIIPFFENMYGDVPNNWKEAKEMDECSMNRFIVNAFTRMRYCTKDGAIDCQFNGPPGSEPSGLVPWFNYRERRMRDVEIVFGHWASLGLIRESGVYSLDSGCVWGGKLTAMRIVGGKKRYYQVQCFSNKRKRPGFVIDK
ncbi:MAG: symmetrical bis(5'-nucleosyl)-tetraphosphatase [Methylococcales bacterium]